MNQKITKKGETKEPYTLKVYQGYKKTERKYWKTLKFPNYEKFEEFVWKLFEKDYKITKKESESYIIHTYPWSLNSNFPSKNIPEIWIYNNKERKCYLFDDPVTDQEKDLFEFLFCYTKQKRKLKPEEIEKLRKKKEELIKKREGLIRKPLGKKSQRP